MLQYPSINGWKKSPLGLYCIAFVKYDGSNLRWEWTPKKGWNKVGTRQTLFDHDTPLYNQAIPIFKERMGEIIAHHICEHYGRKVERIIAFTEFFGPSSFAGTHVENEPKELRLFDVAVYKQGILPARQFMKLFWKYDELIAETVYSGNMNKQFIEEVRTGHYPIGKDTEGVVCKGDDWMAKIKTIKYLEKLKNFKPDLLQEALDEGVE